MDEQKKVDLEKRYQEIMDHAALLKMHNNFLDSHKLDKDNPMFFPWEYTSFISTGDIGAIATDQND